MLIGSVTALVWVPLAVLQGRPPWSILVGVGFAFSFGRGEERSAAATCASALA